MLLKMVHLIKNSVYKQEVREDALETSDCSFFKQYVFADTV